MEYRDYYAALGVGKKASQAEIKKAFRTLAREHHPDVNKGDAKAEQRFKEISEANEVLSDPEKRKAYDQLGAEWASYKSAGSGARPGNPFAGYGAAPGGATSGPGGMRFEYRGSQEDLEGFSDFFRTFFSSAAGGASSGSADGTGAGPLFGGVGGETGAGYAPSGFGTASPRGTSRRPYRAPADATAETTVSLEEVLHGTERHLEVDGKRLALKIPPGVKDGQRIRLSGKASGGGDIYVTVMVEPHRRFKRDGADLSMELPLTLGEALLGAQVSIEALSGKKLLLTIPPATQSGRVFRLAGQGLTHFGKATSGDLRVRTNVVLPTALDEEGVAKARELIEHIQQPDPRLPEAARSR